MAKEKVFTRGQMDFVKSKHEEEMKALREKKGYSAGELAEIIHEVHDLRRELFAARIVDELQLMHDPELIGVLQSFVRQEPEAVEKLKTFLADETGAIQ